MYSWIHKRILGNRTAKIGSRNKNYFHDGEGDVFEKHTHALILVVCCFALNKPFPSMQSLIKRKPWTVRMRGITSNKIKPRPSLLVLQLEHPIVLVPTALWCFFQLPNNCTIYPRKHVLRSTLKLVSYSCFQISSNKKSIFYKSPMINTFRVLQRFDEPQWWHIHECDSELKF